MMIWIKKFFAFFAWSDQAKQEYVDSFDEFLYGEKLPEKENKHSEKR